MQTIWPSLLGRIGLTLALSGALVCAAQAAPTAPAMPNLGQVAHIVHRILLKSRADWKATDLLTQGQAQAIFKQLEISGWKVSDQAKVIELITPESDSLVAPLRTDAGRAFLERVARIPGGYDRLDRLRKIPRGERFLQDMIATPGGEKLIDYLATSPGGAEMGRMLGNVDGGARFNQPTGKIYTEQQLLLRLSESHRRDSAALKQGTAAANPPESAETSRRR